MSNPWGLTPRESQAMDLMLARGSVKGVASALGIAASTVKWHLEEARRKIAPPHKLGHFLAWHDWRRDTQCPICTAAAKSACPSPGPGESPGTCAGAGTSASAPIAAGCASGGMLATGRHAG